jgi:threonine/homoserine/homoserine lactone efflux protein
MGYTFSAIGLGFAIGFVNSIPLGPITVSIIDTSFRRGFFPALMIGLGALVVDVFYCVVGVFGVTIIQRQVEFWLQPVAFPILALLGGRLMYMGLKGHIEKTHLPMTHREFTKNFSLGFLLCLTNPLAIAFWIVTLSLLFSYDVIRSDTSDKLGFIVGMTLGTGVWFFSLARIIAWRRKTMSDRTVRRISIITGGLLVAIGVFLGYVTIKSWLP